EDGALGDEDLTVVRPAVERLKAEGIDARGPLPADSLFHQAARASYDVALAMYHDQALIPIKTLAFDHAVNVTLGLPFVRTSPHPPPRARRPSPPPPPRSPPSFPRERPAPPPPV